MENQKLFDLVKEALGDCERSDIVDAWNEICCEDEELHSMSDFDDVCDDFDNLSPADIICHVRDDFDDFDFNDDFFYVDCGSYYSIDDPYDKVDIDHLISAILEEEVEVDGVDLDELKKECCELRQFKDKEEFEQTTGLILGNVITIRNKELQHIERTGLIVEFRHTADNDRACNDCVCIGSTFYNFDTLLTAWEYRQAGEWKPFGIANTEEKTTDAGSEE